MLLLLLFLTLTISSFIIMKLIKKRVNKYSDLPLIPFISGIVLGIATLILIVWALSVPLITIDQIAHYEAMKITLEDARQDGSSTSSFERASILNKVVESYNSVILKHRMLIKNPWVSIFYSKEIANLDLILWNKRTK